MMTTPATPEKFYVVSLTPEHDPLAKPETMTVCEHHYLQAADCLMIRRVHGVKEFGVCFLCK